MNITQTLPLGYTIAITNTGWLVRHDNAELIHATTYKDAHKAVMSHYRELPAPPSEIVVDTAGWED